MATKTVCFRLPEDLKKELRATANSSGVTLTSLVSSLLRKGLGHEAVTVSDRLHLLEKRVTELERQWTE